jgi:Flp pilus assembly protein TadD
MVLEFTAARAIYTRATTDNAGQIHDLLSRSPIPPIVASVVAQGDSRSWAARGRVALKASAFEMARDSFRRAVILDTRSPDAFRGLSEAAAGKRELSAEISWLRSLAASEPRNAAVRVELSHVLASTGDVEGAITEANDAGRLEPDSPEPMEQLASIFADVQDAARLTPLAETLVARFPKRADGRYYYAASLFLRGRPADAAQEARRVLAMDPRHAKAQNLLGAACAMSGDNECAKTAFETAVELSPRDASPLTNLGFFHLQAGNPSAAAAYFAEAVAIDQESDAARKGLLEARAGGAAR